jgi:4-diphosphocytidyl-2-C-methyl-D-erythritol kinase
VLDAFAKVNLSLQVLPRDGSGLHPLRSLVQSIDWADRVAVSLTADDEVVVVGDDTLPDDESNLAWRAAARVRRSTGRGDPMRVSVYKEIPAAAGLGGGSADAAAALVLAAEVFGVRPRERDSLAAGIGADVPFCLTGGSVWMEGHGERLTPAPIETEYALAVVVPPFPLPTADVYRRWDALDGPDGPAVAPAALPPSLRAHAPLRNDLYPAALSLAPDLGDWTADLTRRWSVPVTMTGSGPALFGYFPDLGEAEDAVAAVTGARAVRACLPVARGWRRTPAGTLP